MDLFKKFIQKYVWLAMAYITDNPTIDQSISRYINAVALSRSPNTARSYQNALNAFQTQTDVRHR